MPEGTDSKHRPDPVGDGGPVVHRVAQPLGCQDVPGFYVDFKTSGHL